MLKQTKTPNFTGWKKEMGDIPAKLSTLANQIIVEIRQNTRNGRDRDGKAFKPYSKQYREDKAKEFGSTTVNLTRTSNMLNNLTFSEIPKGVRIHFSVSSENEKAYINSEIYGRQFLGLPDNRKSYYIDKLKKKFNF